MEDLFQHTADIISISNSREWNNAELIIGVVGSSVNYEALTPEEIVDKSLIYKAIDL